MSAVTVNKRYENVDGSLREVVADVSAAATGDTWASGLKTIKGLSAAPPSTTAVTPNASAGTVTFNYAGGGAMANILVRVIGL
jgi:hypothetical protein